MAKLIITAGGTGQRLNQGALPKQFMELDSVPVIIRTLKVFDPISAIDEIVVPLVAGWTDHLNSLIDQWHVSTPIRIIPGGDTGHLSIQNAVQTLRATPETPVLIHDSVRPFVTLTTILECLAALPKDGGTVATINTIETCVQCVADNIISVYPRMQSYVAKAPQVFAFGLLSECHRRAKEDGIDDFIDSVTLVRHYFPDAPIISIPTDTSNIKITTPDDFYLAKALLHAAEMRQLRGQL